MEHRVPRKLNIIANFPGMRVAPMAESHGTIDAVVGTMKYELYIAGIGYIGRCNSFKEARIIAASYGVSTVEGIGWTVTKL